MSSTEQRTWPNRLGGLIGRMNGKQLAVLVLAGVLLAAIFAFPYATYLEVQESPADPASLHLGDLPPGTTAKHLEFRTREGFHPAWAGVAPPSGDALRDLPLGLGVHWPIVLAMAATVVIISGGAVVLLRSRLAGAEPVRAEPGSVLSSDDS